MGTAGSPRSRIEEPDATTRRLLPPTARPGRPRWRPAYCGVLIALTLAGCGGTARSVSGGTARSSGVRPSPPSSGRPCQSSQLDLALGQPLSEPTGQHSLSRKLTSTSGSRCFLRGYPRIAFYDHKGSAIPFAYATPATRS